MSSETTGRGTAVNARLEVCGYLARNWPNFDRSPLVVNPDARPGDLLAWCWGEVVALLAAADLVVDSGGESMSVNDFSAVFLHRLRPLDAVLSHVIGAMDEQQYRQDMEQIQGKTGGTARHATG